MEWSKGDYLISTDKTLLSMDIIFEFLTQKSYWASNRLYEQMKISINNSICYGVYQNGRQIGFARVVTDYATMFWLCDVFISEEYRGKGLGRWLVECIVNSAELKSLTGMLATRDAHELYTKFGFVTAQPQTFMRRTP